MSTRVMVVQDETGKSPAVVDSRIIHATVVTPSDSTVLPETDGIWVGVGGNLAVTLRNGATVTFTAVPIGYFRVACTKVMSTNTTATTMLACYVG